MHCTPTHARAKRHFSIACGALIALCSFGCADATAVSSAPPPAAADWGAPVSVGDVNVNGTTLHYVRAGAGPALILLHGFPQDGAAYRGLLPRLAHRFTVVVPDLRGVGASAPASAGLDAANMAEDIRQLAERLGLERPFVVGHDIGGIVAYSLGRTHPDALRGIMLLDVPVPGLDPWDALKCNPHLWHMGFFMTPRMPEQLLVGREAVFVREFLHGNMQHPEAIRDEDAERYARAYTGAERLNAALGYYRAFPAAEADNQARSGPTSLPLVLVGSDGGFAQLLPALSASLAAHGWSNVSSEVVKDSGHYLLDEQPDQMSALIERFAGD
jgi:pimeloyl-ACP methyl ester carboxylesterase